MKDENYVRAILENIVDEQFKLDKIGESKWSVEDWDKMTAYDHVVPILMEILEYHDDIN
jgi:hypothetical protein